MTRYLFFHGGEAVLVQADGKRQGRSLAGLGGEFVSSRDPQEIRRRLPCGQRPRTVTFSAGLGIIQRWLYQEVALKGGPAIIAKDAKLRSRAAMLVKLAQLQRRMKA